MAQEWMLKAVLSANAESMLRTLKAVNMATRTTRKHLMDVVSSAGNLAAQVGMPLGLIGAAFGAFTVAGIKQAVTNFADLGDHVVKSAQRLGMTTDEYQQIEYAAGQSGVSVEGLASSMGRLNHNISLAASGNNKNLAALFKKAGISMRDASGDMRSASDVLPEIANLFKQNGNAALQAHMGNALFGKGWKELAPLLQGGKEGIDKLVERYKMLDLTIDEDALKAGEAFGDQIKDLNEKVKNYGNTISAKLIPVLSPMIEQTIKWAVANRDVITTKVTSFIADMATALEKIDWEGVIKGVNGFFRGASELVEMLGGAKRVLIGLVFLMSAPAILAAATLAGHIGKLAFAISGMAAEAVIGAGGIAVLEGSLSVALKTGLGLLGVLGKIAAAGAVGYAIGTWLNDTFVNPLTQIATGDKDQTLGGWIYDKTHPEERQSLIGGNKVNASGKIEVTFANAPQGTRVDQIMGGDIPINTDVGYRGFALD